MRLRGISEEGMKRIGGDSPEQKAAQYLVDTVEEMLSYSADFGKEFGEDTAEFEAVKEFLEDMSEDILWFVKNHTCSPKY